MLSTIIYVVGFIIVFILSINDCIRADSCKSLTLNSLVGSIILGIFSWIAIIGLTVNWFVENGDDIILWRKE